jgi:hypothetical protein
VGRGEVGAPPHWQPIPLRSIGCQCGGPLLRNRLLQTNLYTTGVFFTGMIRVDILWILRVILMLMTVFHMSVLDDYGRTNVSERSKKSGKQQQPTCEDGL